MYYQPQLDFKPEEVIVYLRKSRSDDPALTVEEVLSKHETILDEWAERHLGSSVPEGNKFREIVSGETIADRPEVQKVLRLIESPKYKALLVVEVQRLSRGDLEDAGRLIKLLRYSNTIVITPDRPYDLRDEDDREKFERELKRGNEFLEYQKKIMSRGRLLSVQQGNYIGSKPPYGYDKTTVSEGKKKCHTLKINEEEAGIVRLIFDLYVNHGYGLGKVARHLNEMGVPVKNGTHWTQTSIYHIIDNDHYIGKVRWNWRKTVNVVRDGEINATRPKTTVGEYLLYDGKHEAIISEELFYAARERRGRNTREKATTKVRNPFAGLLFCKTCGRAIVYRQHKKGGVEYSAPRLVCGNQAYCHNGSCQYTELQERITEILKKCIEDFQIRLENDDETSLKLHANLIKRLETQKEELDKKEIAQWEAHSDPDPKKRMPDHIFEILNERLLKEKEEIQQALCKAYESMPEPVDYEEQLKRFQDALDALNDPEADAELKNRLLKACIERIDYSRAPKERIRSTGKRVSVNGRRYRPNALKTGANWTDPDIILDVKLRV